MGCCGSGASAAVAGSDNSGAPWAALYRDTVPSERHGLDETFATGSPGQPCGQSVPRPPVPPGKFGPAGGACRRHPVHAYSKVCSAGARCHSWLGVRAPNGAASCVSWFVRTASTSRGCAGRPTQARSRRLVRERPWWQASLAALHRPAKRQPVAEFPSNPYVELSMKGLRIAQSRESRASFAWNGNCVIPGQGRNHRKEIDHDAFETSGNARRRGVTCHGRRCRYRLGCNADTSRHGLLQSESSRRLVEEPRLAVCRAGHAADPPG